MPGLLKLFVLQPHFEKRFLYAAPLMDSLDVNDLKDAVLSMAKYYKCTQSTKVTTQ